MSESGPSDLLEERALCVGMDGELSVVTTIRPLYAAVKLFVQHLQPQHTR